MCLDRRLIIIQGDGERHKDVDLLFHTEISALMTAEGWWQMQD